SVHERCPANGAPPTAPALAVSHRRRALASRTSQSGERARVCRRVAPRDLAPGALLRVDDSTGLRETAPGERATRYRRSWLSAFESDSDDRAARQPDGSARARSRA